jgi:hypothetical protein
LDANNEVVPKELKKKAILCFICVDDILVVSTAPQGVEKTFGIHSAHFRQSSDGGEHTKKASSFPLVDSIVHWLLRRFLRRPCADQQRRTFWQLFVYPQQA